MAECIYKTCDGYCTKYSDGMELREPCVRMDGPCDAGGVKGGRP